MGAYPTKPENNQTMSNQPIVIDPPIVNDQPNDQPIVNDQPIDPPIVNDQPAVNDQPIVNDQPNDQPIVNDQPNDQPIQTPVISGQVWRRMKVINFDGEFENNMTRSETNFSNTRISLPLTRDNLLFLTHDTQALFFLLSSGTNINTVVRGHTPLTDAVLKGDYEKVFLLLSFGADPNPCIDDLDFCDWVDSLTFDPKILHILSIAGFPNDDFDRQTMISKMNICLEFASAFPQIPAEYSNYITPHMIKLIEKEMDFARVQSYLTKHLGKDYALLWSVENNCYIG